MIRMAATFALILSLGACASTVDLAPQNTNGDVATYDAIKIATEACTAKGGHLVLAPGADSTMMSNYSCRRNGAALGPAQMCAAGACMEGQR